MKKKSQTWAMDILFASLIFIGLFILIYFLTMNRLREVEANQIFIKAQQVDRFFKLTEENKYGFLTPQNIIDVKKMVEFANMTLNKDEYEFLKKKLNLDYDFCVFFEDSEGNIKPIILPNGSYLYGFGNNELILGKDSSGNPIKCGQIINP